MTSAYFCYFHDIPLRQSNGKIVIEQVDGVNKVVYEHRAGDPILDSNGLRQCIIPGSFPSPRWYTREDQERPHPRYSQSDKHYRSAGAIIDALNELTTAELNDIWSNVSSIVSARLDGSAKQVVKSVYFPKRVVYDGGEEQFEIYDDEGNLTDVLTREEYDRSVGLL